MYRRGAWVSWGLMTHRPRYTRGRAYLTTSKQPSLSSAEAGSRLFGAASDKERTALGIIFLIGFIIVALWFLSDRERAAGCVGGIGLVVVGAVAFGVIGWGASSIYQWTTDNTLTETTTLNQARLVSLDHAATGQASGSRTAYLTGSISNNHEAVSVSSLELRADISYCKIDSSTNSLTDCWKQESRTFEAYTSAEPGKTGGLSTEVLFTNIPEQRAVSGKIILLRAREHR